MRRNYPLAAELRRARIMSLNIPIETTSARDRATEFALHYQPKVNLKSGATPAWRADRRHPRRGLLGRAGVPVAGRRDSADRALDAEKREAARAGRTPGAPVAR
jgi:hypothetical protein